MNKLSLTKIDRTACFHWAKKMFRTTIRVQLTIIFLQKITKTTTKNCNFKSSCKVHCHCVGGVPKTENVFDGTSRLWGFESFRAPADGDHRERGPVGNEMEVHPLDLVLVRRNRSLLLDQRSGNGGSSFPRLHHESHLLQCFNDYSFGNFEFSFLFNIKSSNGLEWTW